MNKKKLAVSIIIPTLNEGDCIGRCIGAIPVDELRRDCQLEVIIVDGGSEDGTVKIAEEARAKVISARRRGYGFAYKVGFGAAKGDVLVTLDGDCSYPAHEIPRLVRMLDERGLDFITTNRFAFMKTGAMTGMNRFGNAILSIVAKTVHGVQFNDSQSGMWVIRKAAWETLKGRVEADDMAFSQELKIEFWRAGVACLEVPIEYAARKGVAKLNPVVDGVKNFLHLLYKRAR